MIQEERPIFWEVIGSHCEKNVYMNTCLILDDYPDRVV